MYMQNKSCLALINFKDENCQFEMEEHFKKVYQRNSLKPKLSYLSEYYKFHNEVPRIFIKTVSKNLNCT